MTKKILLFFDGSGVSPVLKNPRFDPDAGKDDGYGNVFKLFLQAGGSIDNKKNAVPGQTCLYIAGVAGHSENRLVRGARMLLGNLDQQIKPMRKMLEEVYEKGDKLYFIGFSRGASAARTLISQITEKGLLTSSGERVMDPEVELLCCFDTVSMQIHENLLCILRTRRRGDITKPSVLGETGGKTSKIVKKAIHNVSIDDNRFAKFPPFAPVLMDSKDDKVHEVWFPGVHGDVGGNFYHPGLGDVSGVYMKGWMKEAGVTFIEPKDIDPKALIIPGHEDLKITPEMVSFSPNHEDRNHINEKNVSHRPIVGITNEKIIEGGTVRIHVSVLQHMEAKEDYKINPTIKDAEIVVVDSNDKVLEEETKKFKNLLEKL